MTAGEAMLLVGAGAIGGALNAVAGGGSFFTFPGLVLIGIPSVSANATSTLALWPAAVASLTAYRRELRASAKRLAVFGGISLVGGIVGAVILVRTPTAAFDRVVPFLMLVATTLFTFGPRITHRLGRADPARKEGSLLAGALAQFVISIYGGYFGGGMGIMMLAAFALMGMQDIHRMNALKMLLTVGVNAAALATFVGSGIIVWSAGLVMVVGAVTGGYVGAAFARRLNQRWVRTFIIVSAYVLTVVFFVRGWR